MKTPRWLSLTFTAAFAIVAGSCTDAPTGPAAQNASPAVSADLLGNLTHTVDGLLLTCTPMREYTAHQTIGPAGGTMVIGPHTFTVPPGALSSPVTISADAPSDRYNRIIFEPEGLQFSRPASLTMSYANCQGLGSLLPKHIAYTTDLLQIISFLNSIDDLFSNKVTGQVNHFSEYIISW